MLNVNFANNSPKVIVQKLPQYNYITSLRRQQLMVQSPQELQQLLVEQNSSKSYAGLTAGEETLLKTLWERKCSEGGLHSLKTVEKNFLISLWKKHGLQSQSQQMAPAEDSDASCINSSYSWEEKYHIVKETVQKPENGVDGQEGGYSVVYDSHSSFICKGGSNSSPLSGEELDADEKFSPFNPGHNSSLAETNIKRNGTKIKRKLSFMDSASPKS